MERLNNGEMDSTVWVDYVYMPSWTVANHHASFNECFADSIITLNVANEHSQGLDEEGGSAVICMQIEVPSSPGTVDQRMLSMQEGEES